MRWQDIARAQHGILTRDQLRLAGVGAGHLDKLSARGLIEHRSYGIFVVGGAPVTYHARLWCAVLATNGLLAFHTAAELWGIAERPDEVIHVLLPHSRRITCPPDVQLHRRRRGAEPHVLLGGLPVTGRRDTVLDQLGVLRRGDASKLADRAVQRGWLASGDVQTRLTNFPRRPGNAQLRYIAAQMGDGAASMAERVLHRILRAVGIHGWKPNYQLWFDGALIAVLDVAVPHLMLAIEVDGMAYHVDADSFQRDRSRQNALVNMGWTVLRFTWQDLVDRPTYVIRTIRRAAA